MKISWGILSPSVDPSKKIRIRWRHLHTSPVPCSITRLQLAPANALAPPFCSMRLEVFLRSVVRRQLTGGIACTTWHRLSDFHLHISWHHPCQYTVDMHQSPFQGPDEYWMVRVTDRTSAYPPWHLGWMDRKTKAGLNGRRVLWY